MLQLSKVASSSPGRALPGLLCGSVVFQRASKPAAQRPFVFPERSSSLLRFHQLPAQVSLHASAGFRTFSRPFLLDLGPQRVKHHEQRLGTVLACFSIESHRDNRVCSPFHSRAGVQCRCRRRSRKFSPVALAQCSDRCRSIRNSCRFVLARASPVAYRRPLWRPSSASDFVFSLVGVLFASMLIVALFVAESYTSRVTLEAPHTIRVQVCVWCAWCDVCPVLMCVAIRP